MINTILANVIAERETVWMTLTILFIIVLLFSITFFVMDRIVNQHKKVVSYLINGDIKRAKRNSIALNILFHCIPFGTFNALYYSNRVSLASVFLLESDAMRYEHHLKKIRNEKSFAPKSFMLALYCYYCEDYILAQEWNQKYLNSNPKFKSDATEGIMTFLFNNGTGNPAIALERQNNPAVNLMLSKIIEKTK